MLSRLARPSLLKTLMERNTLNPAIKPSINRHQQRSLIDISKVIPKSKTFGYFRFEDLSKNGQALMDKLYSIIENTPKADIANSEGLRETLYDNPGNRTTVKALQAELEKMNPEYKFTDYYFSVTNVGDCKIHDDTDVIKNHEFSALITIPLKKNSPQTICFDNDDHLLFTPTPMIPTYFVKPKKHKEFSNQLHTQAEATKDDIGCALFIADETGEPTPHCMPFDINDKELVVKIASSGDLINNDPNADKRYLMVLQITKR